LFYLKQYLKKIIADGFPLEALILDYFECLQMVQNQNLKQYEGEALVMRNLEALAEELNILIITFSQGGRSSVKSSIIQADEICRR
jgi:replicative DNA helicase